MCCSVLEVLHLHSHHGAREGPALAALVGLGLGQQLRRQRRVQGVREQHKLELHLHHTQEGMGCSLRQKHESNTIVQPQLISDHLKDYSNSELLQQD